jgi:hypothetical protein
MKFNETENKQMETLNIHKICGMKLCIFTEYTKYSKVP